MAKPRRASASPDDRKPPRPPRAARLSPSVPLPTWAAVCFLGSGAAGLLYEVVWSKQLAYLLGSSLHAVATVVGAFLGGLALGARLLGVPLARRGRGQRTYALLELGVGLLGLLSLPILRGLDPLVGELYRNLGGESAAFALARFGLLFLLLVPPAALMGATLPVLVEHFERELVGPALARLYALNTFGAVAGSIAGGFALLPGLGLSATTWVAAALNALVATLAWRAPGAAAAAGAPSASTSPPPPAPKVESASAPSAQGAAALPGGLIGPAHSVVAVLFALSGFAALVFQIAWVRLFSLVFGSSVYSFSAVLGVYLLGIALGSALVARWMRGPVALELFGRLQLGLALAAALMTFFFPLLPQWMFDLGAAAGPSWGALFTGEVMIAAGVLLIPCAILGAIFPVATRLLQRSDGGHAAGFAYAINTAGTIAGSLAAGFLLVPKLGVQGTHLLALSISLAIGVVSMALARGAAAPGVAAPGRARRESRSGGLAISAAAVVVVGALAFLAPRWNPALMSQGAFRPAQAVKLAGYASYLGGGGSPVERASRVERVLFYREGINGSVLVGEDPAGSSRWLRVGGKIDASTADMEYQVVLGLIPAALADSGARSLVVGLGSGATAAAVLAAGAGPTEVVELEPAVVDASRFFFEPGKGPLDDPRVRLVLGDARTRLAYGAGRYGLIVSQPSNPWIAGINNLFTVDFYRRVRAHLEPDGVFAQWMQLYELTPETFRTMLASFLQVFPEGQVFAVWRSVDLILVAAPPGRRLALERLSSPAARELLARARLESGEALAAHYAGPLSALASAAKGAALNTDDRPIVEYRAPRDLVLVGRSSAERGVGVAALIPFAETPPPGPLYSAWTEERWFESRARALAGQGDAARAERTARGAERAGLTALAGRLRSESAAAERRTRAQEQLDQAQELIASGQEEEGQRRLERAAEIDPANARTWLMLADRRRLAGNLEGAVQAAARGRAAAGTPDLQAEAVMIAGMIELSRHEPLLAARRFVEAQKLSPRNARAYLLEARARSDGNDPEGARAALRRGLEALPGDAQISGMLAQLGG